jgi:uncharacterized membrane protein
MDPGLLAGMLLFFLPHSIRLVADDWRTRQIARLGEARWKGLYALVSLIGFVLMVWSYPATRMAESLWALTPGARHVAGLLTLPAFILITAAYVPGNRLKAVIGHPMLAGVVLWGIAHLLTNGRPADLLLFGGFTLWATLTFLACRRRDAANPPRKSGHTGRDLIVFAIGGGAWATFVFIGHAQLIGVSPFV